MTAQNTGCSGVVQSCAIEGDCPGSSGLSPHLEALESVHRRLRVHARAIELQTAVKLGTAATCQLATLNRVQPLTRKDIASYQRRRRFAPLVMLLFPFIGMPVALACILAVGFSLAWMGFDAGPAVGAAVFLASVGAVMYGLSRVVRRMSRCPFCTAAQPAAGWLSTVPATCRTCGQPLTTEAFDDAQMRQTAAPEEHSAPQPASAAHQASDEEIRKFRSGLRKGRVASLAWAGVMITCMIAFVGVPREWTMVVFCLFGALGAVGALGLNMFILSRTCPHCRNGFGWRESGYPWGLPDHCAACNQSLHPKRDEPSRQQGVPSDKR